MQLKTTTTIVTSLTTSNRNRKFPYHQPRLFNSNLKVSHHNLQQTPLNPFYFSVKKVSGESQTPLKNPFQFKQQDQLLGP